VDAHDPGIRREHKKLFRGFTSLMVALSDLGVSNADVLRILQIVQPFLKPITKLLSPLPAPEGADVDVNSEQQVLFTVHTGGDMPVGPEDISRTQRSMRPMSGDKETTENERNETEMKGEKTTHGTANPTCGHEAARCHTETEPTAEGNAVNDEMREIDTYGRPEFTESKRANHNTQ
jgi:hypothetical protein